MSSCCSINCNNKSDTIVELMRGRHFSSLDELPTDSTWAIRHIIIRVFYPRADLSLQTQEPRVTVLLGMDRCGSFPLISAPHCLFSIWTDLKRSRSTSVEMRVDLANRTLWTSPEFNTGVKYQFHQGFWPDQRSGNPNHPLPHTPCNQECKNYNMLKSIVCSHLLHI